jgi:hypothetical protein
MGKTFGPLQIGIVLLTLTTAVMHIILGLGSSGTIMVLFLLNGLGYLGLLGALYLPLAPLRPFRNQVRWLLMGYALLTIILYFAFNWPAVWNPGGLFNKAVEAVLIGLLLIERQRDG